MTAIEDRRPARFPGVCPIVVAPRAATFRLTEYQLRTSAELRIVLLEGLRDDLYAEVCDEAMRADAAEAALAESEAARARLLARLVARPRAGLLVACWGALCLFVDAVWSQDMERTVRP